MPEHVRRILSCKRTLLLQEMAAEIDWPDRDFFTELMDGFRLVGCLKPSGIFRPGVTPSALSEDELMLQSPSLKAMILDSISRASPGEHDAELFDLTLKEASSKGWLQGPYAPHQLDSMMHTWLPVRRFCVVQKGKLRAIDDFKENLLNNTCCVAEKIVLQAIDHIIWSLNVLCHFYRSRGACDFSLSSGQRLVGLVHPDWERVGAELKVSSIDLKSAYKQLPLSPCEYDKTVVCLKDPASQKVACFIMHTLPFGALASVYHFLRASFLLHALGCHLGVAWGAFFDDFPMASRSAVACSTQATVRALLSLTGLEFAEDKCPPFHSEVEALGVVLDVSKSSQGIVTVRNKQSRIDELKPVLDDVLATGRVIPCELPSFLGKLQYADAQVWGRAGHMALRDLRSHGSFSRVRVSLDPSGVEAIKLLRDRLISGKPRAIHAAWQEKPMIVFTDGALEEDSDLGAPATVGGVLFDPKKPGCASVFGSMVPSELLQHWRSDGKTHVIGLVELYAAILALRFWRRHLEPGDPFPGLICPWAQIRAGRTKVSRECLFPENLSLGANSMFALSRNCSWERKCAGSYRK